MIGPPYMMINGYYGTHRHGSGYNNIRGSVAYATEHALMADQNALAFAAPFFAKARSRNPASSIWFAYRREL
jgi:hypothetical protein